MTRKDYENGYFGVVLTDIPTCYDDYNIGVKHHREGVPMADRHLKLSSNSEVFHPAAASGAQREKLDVLPYDLFPFQETVDAYSRVAEVGAVKYAPWNWSKGLARVQLLGSLLRHTFAYIRGQNHDPETGLSHTDHILWNAVALSHNVHHNLEDGRRAEPERSYTNGDVS